MSRSIAVCIAGIIPHMLRDDVLRRVDSRLAALQLSATKASQMTGAGRDLIRDWHRRAVTPTLESLAALAPILKVSAGWLAFGEEALNDPTVSAIPLISWVAASRFEDVDAVVDARYAETISVADLSPGRYIALTVHGDSMNMVAPEGSTIVVDINDRELVPRRYYVFALDGAATFKRFMPNPDRLAPYSTNPEHEPIPPRNGIQTIGRVVRVSSDL